MKFLQYETGCARGCPEVQKSTVSCLLNSAKHIKNMSLNVLRLTQATFIHLAFVFYNSKYVKHRINEAALIFAP